MKILRSVTRRGFDVITAGYYTLLKRNTWFAASRFPDRFPNLRKRAEAVAQQSEISSRAENQSTIHLDLKPQPEPLHLVRFALIILVALGITVFLVWWTLLHPQPRYVE